METSLHDWKLLTDAQKTKLLLRSDRLLDEEIFIREFQSWEYPCIEEYTENTTGVLNNTSPIGGASNLAR